MLLAYHSAYAADSQRNADVAYCMLHFQITPINLNQYQYFSNFSNRHLSLDYNTRYFLRCVKTRNQMRFSRVNQKERERLCAN